MGLKCGLLLVSYVVIYLLYHVDHYYALHQHHLLHVFSQQFAGFYTSFMKRMILSLLYRFLLSKCHSGRDLLRSSTFHTLHLLIMYDGDCFLSVDDVAVYL